MWLLGGKKSKQLVGLDIGSSSIKAVELKSTKAGYELVSYGMESLAQDTVVDGAIMDAPQVANAITKIFDIEKIKTKNVATSVSGHSVIVKRVPLPLMTEEELYDRIPSEASQHIPFDIADVNLSYQLLEALDAQMDVLLVAVKKDKILNHTNVLAQAGKTPVVVDIDAFGLQNCFEVNYEPDAGQTVALLNIGASVMNINIVRGGIPLFTRDVSVGGNQYTDALRFGHSHARNPKDLRLFPGHGKRREHPADHGGGGNGAGARAGGLAAGRICDARGGTESIPKGADQSREA